MERVFTQREFLVNTVLPAVVLVATAFAVVAIFYGTDSILRGAHDAFHDFRHAIGMPCH
ncbi:MAG: CbtB-domain containing protein [Deltaproteobacteria bacterium]